MGDAIGIMQPYLFPYIGYFQLMNAVDRWIVFDEVQFIDKGWINRNRILHPDVGKEWQYITVPLANRGQFDKICDISIKSEIDWRSKILGQLTHYKKKAPFYKETTAFVRDCFDTDETNISRFVTGVLKKTAKYMCIDTQIDVQSDLEISIGGIEHPGQWALKISDALSVSKYINPLGGLGIFRPDEFRASGIEISFLKTDLRLYSQRRNGFVPGLSIIDVFMFNDPMNCKKMLDDYSLFQHNYSYQS
jgi:hypothetical protein